MPDLLQWYAPERRARSLVLVFAGTLAIAIFDYFVKATIGLGILYFFPLLVAAGFLSRGQIVSISLVCAILREAFGPATHPIDQAGPRVGIYWVGFAGVTLIMRELVLSRRQTAENVAQLKSEMELRDRETRLREEAERQLHALIESSTAAILTVDRGGTIEMANEAAHRMLGADGALIGRNLDRYIPDASVILNRLGPNWSLRTAMECRGKRENGQVFLGQLWMSHFETHAGPRMAVIVSDASEQLRDREEVSLDQSLSHSRILVAAVSHEIRNLCSAIAISHANLGRIPEIDHNSDYQSLGMLVDGLRRLSSAELMPATKAAREGLPLKTIFDDLRIVLQPATEEAQVELVWRLSPELPSVRADRQGLFQVFLNLSRNSFRAMQDSPQRVLTISSDFDENTVRIRFHDTGAGVGHPEKLFKLFHSGTNSSGIGLSISRAILRSYGGDLRYEPTSTGACFAIELARLKGAH